MMDIAVLIPSSAALVIPPAYPAPSPHGYRLSCPKAALLSSRTILSGALVLVSNALNTASEDANPLIFLSNEESPSHKES